MKEKRLHALHKQPMSTTQEENTRLRRKLAKAEETIAKLKRGQRVRKLANMSPHVQQWTPLGHHIACGLH